MRIVSENSAEDLARFDAEQQVDMAVRELAANLLRVVRGAGRASELGRQADQFLAACEAYREVVGHYPPSEDLGAALHVHEMPEPGKLAEHEYEFAAARESMVRGGLQIAASRLLGQSTQERAGESELFDGGRQYAALREERRKEAERERLAPKAAPTTTKKRAARRIDPTRKA